FHDGGGLLDADVEAQGEAAFMGQLFEHIDGFEGFAHIMEGSDAIGEGLDGGEFDLAAELGLDEVGGPPGLILGQGVAGGLLGGFAEHAGGLAVWIADDFPAGGVGGIAMEAEQFEEIFVDKDGVSADVDEHDGILAADGGEGMVKGQALKAGGGGAVPFILVPAAADDPRAGLGVLGGVGDESDDFVPGAGRPEVDTHERFAQTHKVAVTVDKAGQGELTIEVDDPGAGADVWFDLMIAADGDEGVAAGGEGPGPGPGGVHGDDFAVQENQIGRFGSKRLGAAGKKYQCAQE
ncbi:MAG: hypothetical protein AMJ79_12405, partial [Phycisphaerae bacterium SM23_30]